MCATYNVKSRHLPDYRNIPFSRGREDLFDVDLIAPFKYAPVLVQGREGDFKEVSMQFSLTPHWSQVLKPKFASYNARIETVLEKPTWKKPFLQKPVVVPIKTFFEATGAESPWPHHMIEIGSYEEEWLYAAGVWDLWKQADSKHSPPIVSFAILTQDPDEQIRGFGHDRSPLFLNESGTLAWLTSSSNPNGEEKRNELLHHWSTRPKLRAQPHRALKKKDQKLDTPS